MISGSPCSIPRPTAGKQSVKAYCREAVRDEIDPEQVSRFEKRDTHHRGYEYRDDLCHIGGKQELYCLPYVVIDLPSFFDSYDDCCEIVISKNHIRNILRYIGSSDTHSDSDIGILDRWGIVYSITCHCRGHSSLLPSLDDPCLVLRLYACID